MKKSFVVLCMLFCCFFSAFSLHGAELSDVPVLRWQDMVFVYECRDWEWLVTLRKAVTEGDESGIDAFHAYGNNKRVLKNKNRKFKILTLEDAENVLNSLDRMYVGVLRDSSAEAERLIVCSVEPDGRTVETIYDNAEGHSLTMQYREGAMTPLPDTEPLFSIKDVDGNEIPFYYFDNGDFNYYYSQIPVGDGYLFLTTYTHLNMRDSEWIEIVKFSEMTALPSAFPWLWIALPVGVAVIAGGAAVILLRRKKKKAVAAAE